MPPTGPPTDPRYTGVEAARTYRYLRLGMVALVVLLAASIVVEAVRAQDCLQTSISAYYYTPVRSVFVAALVAIGLCLIVIRGPDDRRDICLNLAGMLAPVVALVPTSDSGRCLSTESLRAVTEDRAPRVIAPVDIAAVQNNLIALFVTGVLALLAAWLIGKGRGASPESQGRVKRVSLSFLLTAAMVGVGFSLFLLTTWFERVAHFAAAGGMFAFLGVVVYSRWKESRGTRHGTVYGLVWRGMLASVGAGVVLAGIGVDHTILVVEIAEILLFVAFWVARAHQDWSAGEVRPASP